MASVWEEIFVKRGQSLKKEQFFGFLKFKYKMAQELGMSLVFFFLDFLCDHLGPG